MRTIHYSIRFAIVLVTVSLFYLGVTFLFHQAIQLPALITLPFTAVCAERLWALLEWIGPVVGTMNKKKQEQEQKQVLEFQLECSLRYASPLTITALQSKKRVSLHVVSRFLRKSDIVLRSTAGYLLILMPFTTLEQASFAFKRLVAHLPIKDVVIADVNMLQALIEVQHTGDDAETRDIRSLRKICFQALDAKVADIKASKEKCDAPVIYNLVASDTPETLYNWLEALSHGASQTDALSETREEGTKIASL
ncbi:MAG: hypothetical protein JOZ18_07545 [Chloroflexi bacterium]|nr:hypothetical protein [Chloroflexota bacterium]